MKSYALLFGVVLVACQPQANQQAISIPKKEHSVQSVLWQQQSSEYKALCYQSFNMARWYLDHQLSKPTDSSKPLAIITDLDETVMDNSFFNAKMIQIDEDYSSDRWADWVKLEQATAIPGAVEFFNYVASKNVEIFYISNRSVAQQMETIANLQKLGFPYLDEAHFLLKDNTSKKQARRNVVLESHEVIMYLGDNLSDFSEVFDGADRGASLDSLQSKFGFEFILLPNPMYGDWETNEIYSGKYDWTSQQKDSIRKAKLRAY